MSIQHSQTAAYAVSCVFYNATTERFSADGCRLISDSASVAECQCTHLTGFALWAQLKREADATAVYEACKTRAVGEGKDVKATCGDKPI